MNPSVEILYMIIDRIFHKINSSKSHPYFYLSPHVYGFGNCAEQIYAGLIRAKHTKKKLVILYPFDIPFIFKYKLTNRALFNLKSDLIVDQGKYVTLLSRALMTIVYMPLRVVGLLVRKFSKFNLTDSYHFPYIGYRYIFVAEKLDRSALPRSKIHSALPRSSLELRSQQVGCELASFGWD